MHTRALVALVAASLGWGLAGVAVRALFEAGATTFTVVGFRIGLAATVVVGFALVRRHRIGWDAWRRGTLIGVIRVGIEPALFIGSLNYISAGVEGLIITLIPVTTALLARIMLGEALSRRQIIGLILGLSGASIMIASGDSGLAEGGNVPLGASLALGGVAMGALSAIYSRRYTQLHSTAELATPMFVSGAIVVIATGWLLGDIQPSSVPSNLWILLLALALGSTLLPFVATLYAAEHVSATIGVLPAYIAPLIGLIGGVVLLDEIITPAIAAGAVLTLAGVSAVAMKIQS